MNTGRTPKYSTTTGKGAHPHMNIVIATGFAAGVSLLAGFTAGVLAECVRVRRAERDLCTPEAGIPETHEAEPDIEAWLDIPGPTGRPR